MVKKLLFTLAVFLAMAGFAWGEGDIANWSGSWGYVATDTVYIPSETRGLSTEAYTAWGFKYYIVNPDTVDVDTVCWVLEMSDTRQCSGTVVLATDTSVNDASVDTFSYWFRPDTVNAGQCVFPEEYWRLTLYLWQQTAAGGDTLYPDSSYINDTWGVSDAGDSTYEALDDVLGSEDTTTAGGYAYAESVDCHNDSMMAVSVGDANSTGWADSVVVFILHVEEDSALNCTVQVAICHSDTGTCDTLGNVICNNDTARTTFTSTTSPSSGEAWTAAELADVLLRFIPIYVSTNDKAKICQAGIHIYYNDTKYFEAVEYKARAILKE